MPQYLLDHMWGKGEACKIVCTQPRRISAISGLGEVLAVDIFPTYLLPSLCAKILCSWLFFCLVAERISYERGENVGDSVGYKVLLTNSWWLSQPWTRWFE